MHAVGFTLDLEETRILAAYHERRRYWSEWVYYVRGTGNVGG